MYGLAKPDLAFSSEFSLNETRFLKRYTDLLRINSYNRHEKIQANFNKLTQSQVCVYKKGSLCIYQLGNERNGGTFNQFGVLSLVKDNQHPMRRVIQDSVSQ